MELSNKFRSIAVLFSLSILVINTNAQAAQTEFSANIAYEGSCEISYPATLTFNNGEAISPSDIETKNAAAKQTFNLTLTECQGSGLTPQITVVGESNTDTGEALFLDATSSTAKGYGILLQNDATAVFKESTNLATQKSILVSDDWAKNTNIATINGTIPMTALLTCGNCKMDGRVGGEIKASVTFEFQYD